MIAVVGALVHAAGRPGADAIAGRAGIVARAAAAAGAAVQVVSRIGEDPAGDALVVALGRAGIGHAALLRDPARPTPTLAAEADESDAGEDVAAADGEREVQPGEPAILPADPALRPALQAEDLDLALRYLPELRTIVAAEPMGADLAGAIAAAGAWAGARLVAIVEEGTPAEAREAFGEESTVLAAPPTDPDGAFARLVGVFAAGLEDGTDPAEAFRRALAGAGWEHAEPA